MLDDDNGKWEGDPGAPGLPSRVFRASIGSAGASPSRSELHAIALRTRSRCLNHPRFYSALENSNFDLHRFRLNHTSSLSAMNGAEQVAPLTVEGLGNEEHQM